MNQKLKTKLISSIKIYSKNDDNFLNFKYELYKKLNNLYESKFKHETIEKIEIKNILIFIDIDDKKINNLDFFFKYEYIFINNLVSYEIIKLEYHDHIKDYIKFTPKHILNKNDYFIIFGEDHIVHNIYNSYLKRPDFNNLNKIKIIQMNTNSNLIESFLKKKLLNISFNNLIFNKLKSNYKKNYLYKSIYKNKEKNKIIYNSHFISSGKEDFIVN